MTADFNKGNFPGSALPDGWDYVPLSSISLEYGNGLTKQNRIGGEFPVYGSNGIVGWHTKAITIGPTIIIGRKGSVGAVHFSEMPCWPIDTTYYIENIPDDIDQKYLFHFLKSQNLSSLDTSTAIPGINRNDLGKILIPKPSVQEQHCIVARLDSILTQINTARQALENIPSLLKALRQSVLAAAFRGELTESDQGGEPAEVLLEHIYAERQRRWEGSLRAKGKDPANHIYEEPVALDTSNLPELPKNWMWTNLDTLLERIEAGHSFKAQGRPAEGGEYGVIKVSAMTWGEFLPKENKALLPEADPGDTPRIKKGDLIISRANTAQLVGAVVLVEEDYPNLLLSDKSLRLVPVSDEISKEFLLYALKTQPVRDVFEGEATGVSESMRNITQEKIKSAPVALPPLQEQARIIDTIRRSNDQINMIDKAVLDASRRLDQLEQATLSKAFRGTL